MELRILSPLHGIYSIYNGCGNYENNGGYYIYSTYYGLVGYTIEIKREDNSDTTIRIAVIQWQGYWDLYSIIAKGITKLERQYIEDKKVTIEFVAIKNTLMDCLGHLKFSADISGTI